MEEVYDKLDSWFEMFKDTKKLKISEAKELAKRISNSGSQLEKERLQEELLCGTISEVYKFIKDNGMLVLCETGYIEFDDLISSLTLAWAEDLDKKVLEVGRYSTLFSRDYFESVAEKLGVDNLSDTLRLWNCSFLGALGSYYRDNDNGVEVSPYFDSCFSKDCKENEKKKTLDIIERGYQKYKDTCFVNSSNTALLGLYGMIFTSIVVREGRYDCEDDFDFVDGSITRMDVEKDILGSRRLHEFEREILVDRYGFDGKGDKTFDEMSENYTVGACRLGQIVAKSLRKLRGDKKVKRYNND
ncbi:MAG: hypothetical protein IJE53_02980 [Bacilli bacterium]|nr:hypothetical protein [Bacilli bacterium]